MHFSSPVRMYRKSCCTTLGIGFSGVSKMLNFLTFKFLCDGQALSIGRAILYVERSCFHA